jgi:hypothetical protein
MREIQWSDAPALTDEAQIRPEDSEEPQGMNDGEPEHDPEPEQPVTGRQKARAAVSKLHSPEMLAKLCTGFKKAIIKIVGCLGPLCSASWYTT